MLFFFTILLLLIIFLSFIYTFGLPMPSSECVFVQWSLHFFSPFLLSLSLSHDLLLYFYFFHFFNLFSFACVYCIVFFSSSDSLLAIQPIKVSKMTLCTPKKRRKKNQNKTEIISSYYTFNRSIHIYIWWKVEYILVHVANVLEIAYSHSLWSRTHFSTMFVSLCAHRNIFLWIF